MHIDADFVQLERDGRKEREWRRGGEKKRDGWGREKGGERGGWRGGAERERERWGGGESLVHGKRFVIWEICRKL